MLSSIDDIEAWCWQNVGMWVAGKVGIVRVEWDTLGVRPCLRYRERRAQDGIRAEVVL